MLAADLEEPVVGLDVELVDRPDQALGSRLSHGGRS
jgi:hypothetical protein